MIRQDLYGSVRKVKESMVLISTQALKKLLGFYSEDMPENPDEIEDHVDRDLNGSKFFIEKIVEAGGDIISLDNYLEENEWHVFKKYTLNEEGGNEIILEIRPKGLKMKRFLMKNELNQSEFFKKRIKELGLSIIELLNKGLEFRDEILNDYKKTTES